MIKLIEDAWSAATPLRDRQPPSSRAATYLNVFFCRVMLDSTGLKETIRKRTVKWWKVSGKRWKKEKDWNFRFDRKFLNIQYLLINNWNDTGLSTLVYIDVCLILFALFRMTLEKLSTVTLWLSVYSFWHIHGWNFHKLTYEWMVFLWI